MYTAPALTSLRWAENRTQGGCGGARTIASATEVIERSMVAGFSAHRHCAPAPESGSRENPRNTPRGCCRPPCPPPIWQVPREPVGCPRTLGPLPRSRLPCMSGAERARFGGLAREKMLLTFFVLAGAQLARHLLSQSGTGSVDAAAAAQRRTRYASRRTVVPGSGFSQPPTLRTTEDPPVWQPLRVRPEKASRP